jgi:hypothetical protein
LLTVLPKVPLGHLKTHRIVDGSEKYVFGQVNTHIPNVWLVGLWANWLLLHEAVHRRVKLSA